MLVTGDKSWLATQGWPVLSGAASFWASRATRAADGGYHINGVTGPDEENPNVNDEAFTNVGAKTTLQDAIQAAQTIGATVPASWSQIAAGLVVPISERSYQPFIRDVFDQFSETRTGGAFTFMTGIGGFLQEFLYGYSGLRWENDGVHIAPSLTGQLRGVVLRNLSWQGRTFQISVGARTTTVTLQSGAPLPVTTPSGSHTVAVRQTLRVPTARPDLRPTIDAVRCQPARASSAQPGAPALAAVDGSPATDWEPVSLPATLTTPTHAGNRIIERAVVVWGQEWPAAPKPNVHPPAKPVKTLRPGRYLLQVSPNGRTWHTVATVQGVKNRTTDTLSFPAVRARMVRIGITEGTGTTNTTTNGTKKTTVKAMPLLQELTVSR